MMFTEYNTVKTFYEKTWNNYNKFPVKIIYYCNTFQTSENWTTRITRGFATRLLGRKQRQHAACCTLDAASPLLLTLLIWIFSKAMHIARHLQKMMRCYVPPLDLTLSHYSYESLYVRFETCFDEAEDWNGNGDK